MFRQEQLSQSSLVCMLLLLLPTKKDEVRKENAEGKQ